jgi:hypothetical protein
MPTQRRFGLEVLGQFISVDDDQRFVWLEDAARPRANPLLEDTSYVIAVQPTPGSAIQ